MPALLACPPKRDPAHSPSTGDTVGVYRARIVREDGDSRRFRLLVLARAPDGFHVEAVAPLGGTALILDGNARRMSVALVKDKIAFEGVPTAEAMAQLVGSPIVPTDLVRAILSGEFADATYSVTREGPPGLPERFSLASEGNRLELRLKRTQAVRGGSGSLTEGSSPDGFDVYPLSDLKWDWFAAEAG